MQQSGPTAQRSQVLRMPVFFPKCRTRYSVVSRSDSKSAEFCPLEHTLEMRTWLFQNIARESVGDGSKKHNKDKLRTLILEGFAGSKIEQITYKANSFDIEHATWPRYH